MASDHGCEWRWHRIGHLQRLLGSGSAKEVVEREALKDGSLTHRNSAVLDRMHWQRAVPGDDGLGFDAVQTPVRDGFLPTLERRDPLYYLRRMAHR